MHNTETSKTDHRENLSYIGDLLDKYNLHDELPIIIQQYNNIEAEIEASKLPWRQ